MQIKLQSLIGIFTIIDGDIKLLIKDSDLISIPCLDVVDLENKRYITENLFIENLDLRQCYTFTEKINNELLVSILYTDIVNYSSIKSNNFKYVSINKLTKNIYIDKLIEYLKKYLVLSSTIKKLYPDEFILPDIQKVYENLFEKKYDRRNFRKRLIKLDIIEDINKISETKKGRPAKLYKFKNITEDKLLI